MKKIFFLLLICFSWPIYALDVAENCASNGIEPQLALKFVQTLQSAVHDHDKNKVADLMSYPLRLNSTPAKIIQNKADFEKYYATLFTEKTNQAILTEKEIFCNYQGAMIANGFIWFETTKTGIKIIAINPEN